jgi:hypothetical protein
MGRGRKVSTGHGKVNGMEMGSTGGSAHGTINRSGKGKQLSYAEKPPSKTFGKGGR